MRRISAVRRWVLAGRPTPGVTALWLLGPLALASGARAALTPILGDTLVYATYYPVALIVTLRLGRWHGVVAMILGGLIANFLFVSPGLMLSLAPREAAGLALYAFASLLIIWTASWLRIAIFSLEDSLAREAELNSELQHRVKNTMAVVQGLASQTARTQSSLADFLPAFEGRLVALGKAHNVLETGRWEVAELPLLPKAALEAFPVERLRLSGPDATVAKGSCTALVLALHELATNAVKYGAWSETEGRVSLDWALDGDEIVLIWSERGGPAVVPPTRRGLGSRLLRSQPGSLTADLRFEPEGVICEVRVPAARGG